MNMDALLLPKKNVRGVVFTKHPSKSQKVADAPRRDSMLSPGDFTLIRSITVAMEGSKVTNELLREYGLISMSLTTEMYSESVVSIEMSQAGLIRLINDLQQLKASRVGEDKQNSEAEIKYTFDEIMKFD